MAGRSKKPKRRPPSPICGGRGCREPVAKKGEKITVQVDDELVRGTASGRLCKVCAAAMLRIRRLIEREREGTTYNNRPVPQPDEELDDEVAAA